MNTSTKVGIGLLAAGVAIIVLARKTSGQQALYDAVLTFTDEVSDAPLEGVRAKIVGGESAVSGLSGSCVIGLPSSGLYTLVASRADYDSLVYDFEVIP